MSIPDSKMMGTMGGGVKKKIKIEIPDFIFLLVYFGGAGGEKLNCEVDTFVYRKRSLVEGFL